MEIRGGVARNRRWAVTSTPTGYGIPNAPTKYLQVANLGANPVRLYWLQADATTNVNYIELAAAGSSGDYFEGPVELADVDDKIWMMSTLGTTVLVVSYQRRG